METMTVEQVAEMMQVTQPTVYRWVREGQLPATRIGRTLRFSRGDVESMVSGDGDGQEVTRPLEAPSESGLILMLTDLIEAELKRRGSI